MAVDSEKSHGQSPQRTDSKDGSVKSVRQAEKESRGKNSFWRVFSYSDATSWVLRIIAIVAAIASGVLLPIMNLIFGKFVTTFNGYATGTMSPADFRSQISKYSLYFVYLFIAKLVLVYIHTVLVSISAIRTTKALRMHFLECTLRQNIAYFDSAAAGAVSTQATTNGNNINQGISEKLTLTVEGVSTFVAAFVIAFAVQWKLTFITISIVPTIIIVTGICITIATKIEEKILPIQSQAGLLAEEAFSTMRTVHAFWLHPLLSSKYDTFLAEAKKVGLKKSPVFAVLFSVEFFCVFSGYGLAFWQGIRMFASGEIKQSGNVFTVILAVTLAATALTSIAPNAIVVTKAASAAADLFKTIDRQSEIDALSESGVRPNQCVGAIEVRNVHFAYPTRPDVPVLQGLDLSVPARKTTALVGASGSGKSTIVGLLERWYDQSEGTLHLDGADVRELNIQWLRTNLRLVQQEPVLFSGTVFDNVVYGLYGTEKGSLPLEDQRRLVQDACKAAYADEFIDKLPQGYETQIGERAMMLSGGQKQRLAIARSIVSDPKVLLLDEATSALDPKAEKIVQQALDNVSTNRTTIVIAHKLSTIQNADNIAVISEGRIIEQGSHEKLIAIQGAYARLVKAQDLGQADDDLDEGDEESNFNQRPSLIRSQTRGESTYGTEKSKTSEKETMNYSLVRCIWILLKEQGGLWHCYLILAAAAILGGLTYPAQAILYSRITRAFQLPAPENVNQGNFYSLMFFIVALGNIFVYANVGWFSNIVGETVSKHYRLEIFNNLLRQNMDFFDKEENATGAIASKLSTYPNNLLDLLGFNLMLILVNIVNLVSSSILALIVGWKLALVAIVGALTPLVLCGYFRIRLEFKLEDANSARFASSAALATEAVSAIRTVSSLALERHVLERYNDSLSGVAQRSTKALMWTMLWYALTQSIIFPAMALCFWYGGRLMSLGEYSTTQFFIVFIGVIFSGQAAAQFFSYTTSITKAGGAANYILWLRQLEPPIREDPDQFLDEKNGNGPVNVQCQNLEFAYATRPNAKVLKTVNVHVQPGQSVAFVGASGCGKTTMIALLERFYDPTSGAIIFDDKELTHMNPRTYRSQISLVQQEPVLYQGSVRDNIAMGLEVDATDAQIEDAARESNIFNFISSLPEGFATLCGSRGTQLSGGQKQRIAIARALIRKPRLLLLDEATSALDTESEKVVQAALEKASSGRTTVAVAHRLSTIKDADCIFVFSRGRIVEKGTHIQLLGKKGMYYEMCLGQSLDRSV